MHLDLKLFHLLYILTCLNLKHFNRFFEEWNANVIKSVPEDRLLVYDVREGWEPLCKFLGLPIPDEPFPRLNDYR